MYAKKFKKWPLLTILMFILKMAWKFLAPSDFKPCYLHEVNMILSYMFLLEEDTWEIWRKPLLSEKLFSLVVHFLVSPPMDTLGVVSVCAFFHHIFLEFYMKLGFKKLGKTFQDLFWSFSPFWLKTVRNLSFWPKMEVVFCFLFFWEPHIIFFYFFLCSRKNTFSLFFGNVKNSHFWPKLTQIWTKLGLLAWCTGVWCFCRSLRKC